MVRVVAFLQIQLFVLLQKKNYRYVKKKFCFSPGLGPQGEALYVNGLLAPDLYLRRGRTYTVVVETGRGAASNAFHPLYITTDPDGGYQVKREFGISTIRTRFLCTHLTLVPDSGGRIKWKQNERRMKNYAFFY